MTRDTTHALSFGKAVADYECGRPGYPAEAVEWMRGELGRAADSALTAVDVGAGTGKFTAALLRRGDHVIAVEPDGAMRETLASKFPEVEALDGRGEALPLADGTADLVTFAQAWHWVDVPSASAEVARVLKANGVLALVWNIRDERVDWVARLTAIMGSSAAEEYDSVTPPVAEPLQTLLHAEFFWDNPLTREELLAMATSRSYIIAMEPDARAEVLGNIEQLLDEHPELAGLDHYTMPYVTRVTLARSTSTPGSPAA